ncbi:MULTISPECIES: tRNA (N6-threonylcarbamoyladenosine(37)-N6)-methyltransferase TrmO [Eikenella]|uniref:tRNA-Thr(GGU) m(6)t(6)A37 methyltransferase TsaA n=1 Tax=Eikenella longinqua TaxID=1795827 RepID=A0A1A9RW17_9NEIS|nr:MULTISPECIES: tRNA (N6-threonylcarbamoyladenosine(37)-N6)-methyltransferase TrmO [Eikenella]OAM26187.1 tRNA-Thr(GGU) m(6)t(6)A37 methyltransferase TsaA [Eikenella longinqua]
MCDIYSLRAVGFVRSPYKQKFGVPRQPGLVPAAGVCIELLPEFSADCVRGLELFSHVWVQFVFHGVAGAGWQPLVRPPRLGGNRKMGVFATRSPFRPNPLGLSLLKLERIDTEGGVRLWCGGADLLDSTPVLDIKPYLPFVEAKPDAAAGFAPAPPVPLRVVWAEGAGKDELPPEICLLVEQSIAQDPRPAYQDAPLRVYKMAVGSWEVAFRIEGETAVVEGVEEV